MTHQVGQFLIHETDNGITTIDGQPMVFHCNHYNRNLQNTIENCRHIDSRSILIHSAAEVAFSGLREHFEAHPELDLEHRLQYAENLYSYCGFGLLPLTECAGKEGTLSDMTLSTSSSHYGRALQLNFDKRRGPGEYFDLGFAIGALSAAFESPFGGELTDDAISQKGNRTAFKLAPYDEEFRYLFQMKKRENGFVQSPGTRSDIPDRDANMATGVDEAVVIAAVAQAPLFGNERGLIPAFGVELSRQYADYYNLISYRFEQRLSEALENRPSLNDLLVYDYPSLFHYQRYTDLEGMNLTRSLLTEAGHICGFNTMGGIMSSETWDELLMPMIQNREDWMHGIIAVINALGWGVWRVVELVPNEKLVLRVWRPYESLGYLRWFGKADRPVDYLVTGVAASLMNLLYVGDITQRPNLDLDYYHQINRAPESFWGEQVQCVAMGDEYSEVVVTRRSRG